MEKPLLSDGGNNVFAKIAGAVLKKPREISIKAKNTDYSFKTSFYTDNPIGMEDIIWRSHLHCPDCDAQPTAEGQPSGWYVCGGCRQLFYADKFVTDIFQQKVRSCPWCGIRNKITPDSAKHKWRIRGQEVSESQTEAQKRLAAEKPKSLGDGKNK